LSNDPHNLGQQPPPYGPPPPGMWPPGPGQWVPGPPWNPPPPRRPRRSRVIGAVAGVLVLVAAGAAVVLGLTHGDANSPTAQRSPSSSSVPLTTPPKIIRVLPGQVLPSDDQVRQATLIEVTGQGDIGTVVGPDLDTQPPNCTLVNGPMATSAVGQAISVAYHNYTERPGPDYGATAWAFVAVFDTADAAAGALAKVTHDVQSCMGTYTDLAGHAADAPPAVWAISAVKVGDSQISWNNTNQPDSTHWVCGKAIRVQTNVLVTAMLCTQNPADGPVKIIDAVMDNVNAHK
jgi:hypothetical protein